MAENKMLQIEDPTGLTEEDRTIIAYIISNSTALPTVRKTNGLWVQQNTMDILEGGYRIFNPEDANANA